jgi:hypothetical protein
LRRVAESIYRRIERNNLNYGHRIPLQELRYEEYDNTVRLREFKDYNDMMKL